MTRLLSYYGDDFTGSTDVMEALSVCGVETALFTRLPSLQEFAPFAHFQAIGLAGNSRSQTPEWMDAHLPAIFKWLKNLDAKYCHYKTCSTFDSSPSVGSIGRAIEIAQREFNESNSPLIIGSPRLKRYTFTNHLFAAYQNEIFRIDRHPVMQHHPITPMTESDVVLHLAKQSTCKVQHLNVWDEASLLAAGEAVIKSPLKFLVGSSGVQSALLAAMKLEKSAAQHKPLEKIDRMLVVSGSVSPSTARQIEVALQAGFKAVAVDPLKLVDDENEIHRVINVATEILQNSGSPLIYTAQGPASDQGAMLDGKRAMLSHKLGLITRDLISAHNIRRVVVAGGDTSSHALGALDIHALTLRLPLHDTPGSPVCLTHSADAAFNHLEIALKGGQVGGDDYFVKLRDGVVAS
jgi:3-oxoisoapionate kinase